MSKEGLPTWIECEKIPNRSAQPPSDDSLEVDRSEGYKEW